MEKLGHKYEKVEELEDNLEIPRAVYRSKESFDASKSALLGSLASIGAVAAAGAIFASGGALAVTLGSGLIGAEVGGFVGGVLGELVEEHHAKYLHGAARPRRSAALGANRGRPRGKHRQTLSGIPDAMCTRTQSPPRRKTRFSAPERVTMKESNGAAPGEKQRRYDIA